METVTVQLEFPRNLLGALDVPENQLENRLKELIILELVESRMISLGKGAELLGKGRMDFIRLLAKKEIAYFTESPDELSHQILSVEQMLEKQSE